MKRILYIIASLVAISLMGCSSNSTSEEISIDSLSKHQEISTKAGLYFKDLKDKYFELFLVDPYFAPPPMITGIDEIDQKRALEEIEQNKKRKAREDSIIQERVNKSINQITKTVKEFLTSSIGYPCPLFEDNQEFEVDSVIDIKNHSNILHFVTTSENVRMSVFVQLKESELAEFDYRYCYRIKGKLDRIGPNFKCTYKRCRECDEYDFYKNQWTLGDIWLKDVIIEKTDNSSIVFLEEVSL